MPPLEDEELRARMAELWSHYETESFVDWSKTARRNFDDAFAGTWSVTEVNKRAWKWVKAGKKINVVPERMEQYQHKGDRYEIRFPLRGTSYLLYFYLRDDCEFPWIDVGQFKPE